MVTIVSKSAALVKLLAFLHSGCPSEDQSIKIRQLASDDRNFGRSFVEGKHLPNS